ncbi:hypothetical protein HPB50_021310 [Hyalomma asiaticum]|uniref:Uncharacterized protein n=1 Tax=Hyalomma asiaticum TaxID=266040 RepID=A0ACB7SE45_HYAAI|nr:hypothetical protein HPB50_021310 [Hyalomma asiaticum]
MGEGRPLGGPCCAAAAATVAMVAADPRPVTLPAREGLDWSWHRVFESSSLDIDSAQTTEGKRIVLASVF